VEDEAMDIIMVSQTSAEWYYSELHPALIAFIDDVENYKRQNEYKINKVPKRVY
jgi:uncharacterized protein (DUF1499 family)